MTRPFHGVLLNKGTTLTRPITFRTLATLVPKLAGVTSTVSLCHPLQMAKKQVNLSVKKGEKLPVSKGAGLTAKGRAKYNRETGSNLKAPAPNPKTKADAARKKSFCARMSGMPGPMKDKNGNPTRKAASLKRWNCR